MLDAGANEITALEADVVANIAAFLVVGHRIAGCAVDERLVEGEAGLRLDRTAPFFLELAAIDLVLRVAEVGALDLGTDDARAGLHVVAGLDAERDAVAIGEGIGAAGEAEATMRTDIGAAPAKGWRILIIGRGEVGCLGLLDAEEG
ncbi:hypothetical protein D9M72_589260 [compost metagenome]